MSKAMLIMDMPNNCKNCPLSETTGEFNKLLCVPLQKEYNNLENTRPSQCPLKFVPSKKYHSAYGNGKIEMSDDKVWNRCIDTILGQ